MMLNNRFTYKTNKRDVLLVLASASIGYAGFTTIPRAAALVLAVPILWTMASSRYAAFAVVFAYKLAASRGLLPGAAVFLSEDHTLIEAAALYLLMPLGASLPFGVFWSEDGRRKAICLVLAFVTAYVLPPFSLIGIINPLVASGTIFNGWGFAGMLIVLGIYALCAVSRKTAVAFLCVIWIFASVTPDSWYEPPKAEGIMSIDTSFGKLGSGSFNFAQDYERANMVFSELRDRIGRDSMASVVILPETIAGRLNDTGLELWKSELEKMFGSETAVLFGAELPAGDGGKYDNAILMLHGGNVCKDSKENKGDKDSKISVSRQRIPVPYSMYRGPFAKTGANLHLLDGGILELLDGRKAAVIVCYEAFLTWPFIASMIHKPDMIISAANLWWCKDTSLPATRETIITLWSLLFGTPAVFAKNI